MKKRVTLFGLGIMLFAFTSFGFGQNEPTNKKPSSTIVVQATGLNCSTSLGQGTFEAESWSFGATDATDTSSGVPVGKAAVGTLNVRKNWDECSPELFLDTVSGKVLKTVTLTQSDKNNVLLTVKLTNALLTSFQIGGSQSETRPMEKLSFDFEKICIQDTSGGTTTCFNKGTATGQ
jgi:type VI secretion system Hcp family effector